MSTPGFEHGSSPVDEGTPVHGPGGGVTGVVRECRDVPSETNEVWSEEVLGEEVRRRPERPVQESPRSLMV